MTTLYYDADAHLERLTGRRVAVIGYGSQGHAHALNLRASGVDVRIGLPVSSRSRASAQAEGLRVATPEQAAEEADFIVILTPDHTQRDVYEQSVAPHLKPGKTLLFAHGFNIRFGEINPSKDIDVIMVAPKAPGHRVREVFVEGGGVPALVAVHNDYSGHALADALAYAKAIGSTRAGVLQTTFAEETETDLFGEQAVLCGGAAALVKAGFETLVKNGYQPEIAYFECMHELKLIVDLMYRGGLNYMRHSVSDTAEYGDYTAGDRIVTAETKQEMQRLLDEVRDGSFARKWITENRTGRAGFEARRIAESSLQLESVGRDMRRMMPFLDAKEVLPGQVAISASVAAGAGALETASRELAGATR